jgi:hypothetical protein
MFLNWPFFELMMDVRSRVSSTYIYYREIAGYNLEDGARSAGEEALASFLARVPDNGDGSLDRFRNTPPAELGTPIWWPHSDAPRFPLTACRLELEEMGKLLLQE